MTLNIRRNFSNAAAATTLSSGITASSTSLVVTAAGNYPDAPFTVRLENEIVLVGAKSGTTFSSLTRGYDGTVATSHSGSTPVTHVAIAEDFRHKWLDVIVTDDAVTAYDDEFDGSSTATWNEVTPTGTASWTQARGVLSVIYDAQASADFAAYLTSIDGLSYPLYIITAVRSLGNATNYQMVGLAFSSGVTSASTCTIIHYQNTERVERRYGTWGALASAQTAYNLNQKTPWLFLRLDWTATNTFQGWISSDGVSWTSLGVAYSQTLTPTHYGLAVSTWGIDHTFSPVATFDFFRVYNSKPTYWQEG